MMLHHQAENPKMYNSRSASQAPTLPPQLNKCGVTCECDHPGSTLEKDNRIRIR